MTLLPATNHPINCGLALSTFNKIFSKRLISNRKFDITATPIQRVLSYGGQSIVGLDKNGSTSSTILKNVTRNTGSTSVTDYIITTVVREDGYFQKIKLSSNSANILSNPNETTKLSTYQSNGSCVFSAISEDGETSLIKVESILTEPVTVDKFHSWANGSLAKHCTDQINTLISGKTQLNIFLDPYGPSTFNRNSNCWANGVDISCASPWNSDGGAFYSGTLISPRHVVFCAHSNFYPKNGSTIKFVSSNGTIINRIISNSIKVSNADIVVAILESDVDQNIKFAKILPSNWSTYLPGLNRECTIPTLCLNQTERASISALYSLNLYFNNIYPSQYSSYYGDIILYDSGNPVFIVINGEPILLGVFTTGGAGSGANISYHMSSVNNAMSTLGGGYQLTTVDLSSFNTY